MTQMQQRYYLDGIHTTHNREIIYVAFPDCESADRAFDGLIDAGGPFERGMTGSVALLQSILALPDGARLRSVCHLNEDSRWRDVVARGLGRTGYLHGRISSDGLALSDGRNVDLRDLRGFRLAEEGWIEVPIFAE
jgi:hypothetical protein